MCPIAQREIPAYAGMTYTAALVRGALEEIPAYAGMTAIRAEAIKRGREIPAYAGMTRPSGNDGECNLLRPGRNPCRKSKR